MRINKYLAESNVASRRASDELVISGSVKVNGKVIKTPGYDVNEENDIVTVNGEKVTPVKKYQYYMLNKPKGYVTTVKDEFDRKTVMSLIKEAEKIRLFPVGRLDYDTEGLLIITNDGDLANRLTHPKNSIPKTYAVKITGEVKEADIEPLRKGIVLDGEKTNNCKVKIFGFDDKTTKLEITITEGRNRQVRRMFEAIGRRVEFLKRIRIGDLKVGGLSRGEYRKLRDDEVYYLKNI